MVYHEILLQSRFVFAVALYHRRKKTKNSPMAQNSVYTYPVMDGEVIGKGCAERCPFGQWLQEEQLPPEHPEQLPWLFPATTLPPECALNTEIARLVCLLLQTAHGIGWSASFMDLKLSNRFPHSWHTYSYSGIATPFLSVN